MTGLVAVLAAVASEDLIAARFGRADTQQPSPKASPKAWRSFSADISVQQGTVDGDGRPIGLARTPAAYHWSRTLRGNRWITSVTVVSVPGQTGAPLISRIEDDGDGTPARLFDRNGGLVAMPTEEERHRLDGPTGAPIPGLNLPVHTETPTHPKPTARAEIPDWLSSFVAAPDGRKQRRDAFEQRFGRSVGVVAGRDRFLKSDGISVTEVLLDPSTALPVEVNSVRQGALVAHVTTGYAALPDGSLIPAHVHSENLLPQSNGQRNVTDVHIANARLSTEAK
jgi:hypothetical protein